MRKPVAALAAAALASALIASAVGAQAPPDEDDMTTLVFGGQIAPKSVVDAGASAGKAPAGPNPYLALLPDVSTVDYAGWRAYLDAKSQQRADLRELAQAAQPQAVSTPIVVDEEELAGLARLQRLTRDGPTGRRIRHPAQPEQRGTDPRRAVGGADPDGRLHHHRRGQRRDPAGRRDRHRRRDAARHHHVVDDRRRSARQHRPATPVTSTSSPSTATAGQTITVLTATPTGPLDTMVFVYDSAGDAPRLQRRRRSASTAEPRSLVAGQRHVLRRRRRVQLACRTIRSTRPAVPATRRRGQ